MLVLSRKPLESILIGDNIEVQILRVNGNRVKVGIEAPQVLAIHRKEVWLEIHGDKQDEPE